MFLAPLSLLATMVAVACSSPERPLRVSGPTPFVRCLGAAAAGAREVQVGRVRLRFQDRSLRIEGLSVPARVAAFSGPAFQAPPSEAQLDALRAAAPDLLLVLGDLGDDRERARATLAGLAGLSVPVLVLSGGRDTMTRTADAIDVLSQARTRVVDISPLTEVRLAGFTWVPLAGAYDGHYANSDQSCGYGPTDFALRATVIRSSSKPRLTQIVAWERPEAWPSVSDGSGAPGEPSVANADVAEVAARAGGIFAWPAASFRAGALLEPGQAVVVPRLTGPFTGLDDGSRVAPGFVLLLLDAAGLTPIAP